MKKWTLRVLASLAMLVVVSAIGIWGLLTQPVFKDARNAIVSEILSQKAGQTIHVDGDVHVALGSVSQVNLQNVRVPSTTIEELDLARLESLQFEMEPLSLFSNSLKIENPIVSGLIVTLLRDEKNRISWGAKHQKSAIVGTSTRVDRSALVPVWSDVLLLLAKSREGITDVDLSVIDAVTGFSFDFEMPTLSVARVEGGPAFEVFSEGLVNGQDFTVEAHFAHDAPFKTVAKLGSSELRIDGTGDFERGYGASLILSTPDMSEFLDILGLESPLRGTGQLVTEIEDRNGIFSVSDIDAVLRFDQGQEVSLQGRVNDLNALNGVDLMVDTRLYSEDETPQAANTVFDIKLTSITARIVSERNALVFEELLLKTNAFEQGLDRIGPVSIGEIARSKEGELSLTDITMQAGPIERPLLKATGNIEDMLSFQGIQFRGQIDAPASLVLAGLGDDVATAFGKVEGSFALGDVDGSISLTEARLKAVETEVWGMDAAFAAGDIGKLHGLAIDAVLRVADSAAFLEALDLQPIDAGALELSASIEAGSERLSGEFDLSANTSQIGVDVSLFPENGRHKVHAEILSDALDLVDVKASMRGISELSKIGDPTEKDDVDEKQRPELISELPLQPLVLPVEGSKEQALSNNEKENAGSIENERDPTSDLTAQLLDIDTILLNTDVLATIVLNRISGVQGVTKLSSEFSSIGGKAQLGPIEFSYGGGNFNLEAKADVVNAPSIVNLSGATSGWTLANMFDATGIDFDADGALRGRFNLSGKMSSPQVFLKTASGRATIEMSNGWIATSLLELAGLGIFPWLFSNEFRKRHTDITCVVAPVRIDGGALSFDSVVAETKSVQVVARGEVDVNADVIDLRAEPRPVGKPLARSALPFEVSGKLSDPRFKVLVGGARGFRSDGADRMPDTRVACRPDIQQLQ